MQDVVWICTFCSNQQTEGRFEQMKMIKRYVDMYLKFANSLHNNLQFSLGKFNIEEVFGFS